MFLKDNTLPKGQVTYLTMVRLQFLMDLLNVTLQDPFELKSLGALTAHKRFILFVDSLHVFIQGALSTKVFLTNFTFVKLLLKLKLIVNSINMSPKVCFILKHFLTNFAL
jgi:hypothetical protein